MEIRPLRDTADVHDALGVNARAWQAAFDDVVPEAVLERFDPDRDLTDDEAEAALAARRGDRKAFLVAEVEGSVVGYAYVRWGEDTKAFVDDGEAGLKELYVDPDHWEEGVGTSLLERCLEGLPDDIERVRLETLVGNQMGRRFYEARGFERTGRTTAETGGEELPAVVYTREC